MKKYITLISIIFFVSCFNPEQEETGVAISDTDLIEQKDFSKTKKQQISDSNNILQEKEADNIEHVKIHNDKKRIKLVSNPNIRKDSNSITFSVNNVKKATNLLEERSYKYAIQSRPVKRIEYCNKEDYSIVPTYIHPFVKAVELAYAEHRPLVLSPDIIWLLICQGFSKHIEVNKDKFRDKIVDFENKKSIDIFRSDFVKGKTNNLWWQEIIKDFTDSVKSNIIDTALYTTVVHSFSTTTEKELISFEITFLEINKHYFKFTVWACGIPEITLEGNTKDWIWIRENIEKFRDYELSWWIDKLIPTLDEFIEASQGNINLKFWGKIYRDDKFCNHELTGWFAKFFPYIRVKNNKLIKNPLVLNEPINNGLYFPNAIENENFIPFIDIF